MGREWIFYFSSLRLRTRSLQLRCSLLAHYHILQRRKKKNKRLLAVYWQSRFMTDQTYNKVGDFHQLLAILLTLGVLTLQVNVLL